MSNELKPCPFCGGEAAFGANSCQGFEYVRCASCKARTWSCYDTKEQAAEAWNTRAEREVGISKFQKITGTSYIEAKSILSALGQSGAKVVE